jgi:zinc protease
MKPIYWILLLISTSVAAGKPPLPPPPKWEAPVPALQQTAVGVKVATLPRADLPLAHVLVTVKAGADLDPPDRPGLAAAVATMLQDGGAGARGAPELAAAIEALGGELQIVCDRAGVRLQLTVMSRHLDEALALLGDLLVRPRFDAEEWARVRARRVAEIARARDEPRAIADTVFHRAVYGAHPYGHPVLGTQAAVEKLSAEDLAKFYAAHYGPRTTSVVLVGEVGDGAKRVERAFAGWTSRAAPAPAPPSVKPAGKGVQLVLVDRPGAPQSELFAGHVAQARSTPDYAPMIVAETVLGGSFTSRLVQNLREKHGYTYGVNSRFILLAAPGPLAVRSAIRTDVTADAVKEMMNEIKGMSVVSEDDVKKGRSLRMNAIVDAFASGQRTDELVGDLLLFDLPLDTWAKLPSQLGKLDAKSVVAAVKRLIQPEAMTIVVVGDRKAIEGGLRALPFVKSVEIRDVDGNLAK